MQPMQPTKELSLEEQLAQLQIADVAPAKADVAPAKKEERSEEGKRDLAPGKKPPRTFLDFTNMNSAGKGVQIVQKYPQATAINFTRTNIQDADLCTIASLRLQVLNIGYNDKVTDRGIEGLVKCQTLTELRMSHCPQLSSKYVALVAKNLPHLRILDLDYVGSKCKPQVKARDLIPQLEPLKDLTCLNLSNLRARNDDIALLTKTNPKLQSLTLFNNKKHSSRFTAQLISHCAKFSDLQILRLDGEFLRADVVGMISKCCPKLRTLYLWNASPLSDDAVLQVTNLKDLNSLSVTFTEGMLMWDMTKAANNGSVQKVSLCDVNAQAQNLRFFTQFYTDAAICKLVELKPDMQEVSLSNAYNVSDIAVEALSKLKFLRTLQINDSQHVTPKALPHLASCENLRYLTIKRCPKFNSKEQEKTVLGYIQQLKEKNKKLHVQTS